MKFKTTAIALAVAGTVAVPMAAQADLYASARIGISSVDSGGVDELSIGGVASRFGMRSETDLGNGMTGFGRYEFSVNTETSGTNVGNRHAYVGVKGDFGSVTVGRTYHTFYNHLVGPLDIPWVGSGFAMVGYIGRTSEQASYAGSVGAVSWGFSAIMADNATATNGLDGLDGFELAATFGIGDMSLAVGTRDLDGPTGGVDPDGIIGVTLHGVKLGDASFGIGYQAQEDDTSITLEVDIGNVYIHYEGLDCDANPANNGDSCTADWAPNTSPSLIAVGYNQPLGRNTMMWYEFHQIDADTGNSNDDVTGLYATLKYDIE